MKSVSKTLSVALAFVALVCLSSAREARAQGTHRGQHYTKADVERIIKRVEERSDAFRKVVDRTLDRSALDGTNREDNVNQQVKELENAMNEADEVNAIVRRGRWRRAGAVKQSAAVDCVRRLTVESRSSEFNLQVAACATTQAKAWTLNAWSRVFRVQPSGCRLRNHAS